MSQSIENPSTSSGSEDTQGSLETSSDTTQADSASGAAVQQEGGNFDVPLNPSGKFISEWLTKIENGLVYSTEFIDAVAQWFNEHLSSPDIQITEVGIDQPAQEDRPRAIYAWQCGSPTESALSSSSTEGKQKAAPVYWWHRTKGLRSTTAFEVSSSSSDRSDADVAMVADLENCYRITIPKRRINLKTSEAKLPPKEYDMSSSSDLEWIAIPNSLLQKCKPRRSSKIKQEDSSSEEEVPPFCFVRRRRSSARKSRSLERDSRSSLTERESGSVSSPNSSKSTELLSEQQIYPADLPSMRHKLRRVFVSEDNLLHKIGRRGNAAYCSCLCVWYKISKGYKKVSAGIRKMNRENR